MNTFPARKTKVGVLSELATLFDRRRNVASSESTPTLLQPTSFLKKYARFSPVSQSVPHAYPSRCPFAEQEFDTVPAGESTTSVVPYT